MLNVATRSVPQFSAVRKQPIATKSAAVRRKYIRQVVFLLLLCISLTMVFVWIRVQVIQLGYDVSRVRSEVADLTEQRNILESEVAALKSPDRLTKIGLENFGMRFPQASEIVHVGGAEAVSSAR